MNRPNRVLMLLVGAILAVAVVAAVLSATRSPAAYDPDSPEGTVQAYLEAALQGDNEEAAGYFAADSGCDAEDLDRAHVTDSARVVLVDTDVEGDRARVDVEVAYSSGGPFDTSEYTEDQTFRLARAGQQWELTGTPWPLFGCGGEGR